MTQRGRFITSKTSSLFQALCLLSLAPLPASAQTGARANLQSQGAVDAFRTHQEAYASYQQQMAMFDGAKASVRPALPVARTIPAPVRFGGSYMAISPNLPMQVQYAINAANCLQDSPYARGRGHRQIEDLAYDCSSSTSYTLIKAGLLQAPLTSEGFARYGAAGPGRFITVWVKPGDHVFMTICGVRLDTSGGRSNEGPRWRSNGRSTAGFFPRHPPGF